MIPHQSELGVYSYQVSKGWFKESVLFRWICIKRFIYLNPSKEGRRAWYFRLYTCSRGVLDMKMIYSSSTPHLRILVYTVCFHIFQNWENATIPCKVTSKKTHLHSLKLTARPWKSTVKSWIFLLDPLAYFLGVNSLCSLVGKGFRPGQKCGFLKAGKTTDGLDHHPGACFVCAVWSAVNCWFGARWFGFLGSPYLRDLIWGHP